MEPDDMADLAAAHDDAVAAIRAIPDAALDWPPGDAEWSLKRIIGHLAHANDFYMMIVDEVFAANFGHVRLHDGLPGFQRMAATDAVVAGCRSSSAALDCFERTYGQLLAVLQAIAPADLDRPFALATPQPDGAPAPTTIRQRVIRMAAAHLREHQPHLNDILARWRAARHAPNADGSPSVPLDLREADQAWNDAYAYGDVAALDGVLADEWTAIAGRGDIVTKAQILAMVATTPWPFTTYVFDEVVFRIYGETAVVTGRLTGSGQSGDQPVQIDQRYLRVYVRRAGRWRAVVTQVTPVLA
jgi:ketosteroid isomerase-like protein